MKNYDDDNNDRASFEDVLLPANDNAGPKRKPARLGPSPYTTERVALLLALAGYDPERIPVEKRLPALHVAWCFAKSIFDEADVARAARRSRSCVRDVTRYLRDAAKPGTVVG